MAVLPKLTYRLDAVSVRFSASANPHKYHHILIFNPSEYTLRKVLHLRIPTVMLSPQAIPFESEATSMAEAR